MLSPLVIIALFVVPFLLGMALREWWDGSRAAGRLRRIREIQRFADEQRSMTPAESDAVYAIVRSKFRPVESAKEAELRELLERTHRHFWPGEGPYCWCKEATPGDKPHEALCTRIRAALRSEDAGTGTAEGGTVRCSR